MKDILIKLRTENRYSQSALAKELGISRQAYMKYESGEVEPSVEIVRRLSRIYGVSYQFLIDNGVIKPLYDLSSLPDNLYVTENATGGLYAAEPEPAYGTLSKGTYTGSSSDTVSGSSVKKDLITLINRLSADACTELLEMAQQFIQKKQESSWVTDMFTQMDAHPVTSDGITWTREELYER